MRFAGEFASRGNDVLIEGLRLSSEVLLSAQLAAAHHFYILFLSTSIEQCARNLLARRRVARGSLALIERATAEEHWRVREACARLQPHATVDLLDFDAALERARNLLELNRICAAA
jgi:hypothetical protein